MNKRRTMLSQEEAGTKYSLVVNDNLSGASGAATNATVTVKYTLNGTTTTLGTTFKNGDEFVIPEGATDITVTGNNVTNFAPNTTVSDTTYTVLYRALKVTVTINGNDRYYTVYIKNLNTNVTLGGGGISEKILSRYIAWGDSWKIDARISDTTYPSSITVLSGTANSESASTTVTYSTYNLITSGDVDLGLPSGNIWSATNVGASSYTDVGLYFSWGNVDGHAKNSGYNFNETNYSSSPGSALRSYFTSGDATYDAARANMGETWRVPSKHEFNELIDDNNTIYGVTVKDHSLGVIFISKKNGNGIFFPFTGYYSSTSHYDTTFSEYWMCDDGLHYSTNFSSAYHLCANYSNMTISNKGKYVGIPVRAVKTIQYVDLGLPSGTKWANCNIGTSSPFDLGLYFSWGDIVGHGNESGYKFDNDNYNNGVSGSGHNLTSSYTSGDSTYDAARANLGSPWRTPTKEEYQELIDNCTFELKQLGLYRYYYVVTGPNGKSIVLPSCGFIYNSSVLSNTSYNYYDTSSHGNSRYRCVLVKDHLPLRLKDSSVNKETGIVIRPVQ